MSEETIHHQSTMENPARQELPKLGERVPFEPELGSASEMKAVDGKEGVTPEQRANEMVKEKGDSEG
ncbi:hypothetical protein A0H81_03629 [Grifola frondosa]|uniref:Uncharacterized protein n=1 Tax=Grifola frondosa TaxID=5627 RepID=A0A1C7MH70_GRIFR|nr:hypothetical protein A0H81_03629 [Grifola frondosa]